MVMKSGLIRPLLLCTPILKHSFYIIPHFIVFLQVKNPGSILGKFFSSEKPHIFVVFPLFFFWIEIFFKKSKKMLAFFQKVGYTMQVG